MKRKVADLEKALRQLEEIQCTLVAGQVAFEVDKAVLKWVMEAIGCPKYEHLHIFNISDMEKAIKREDNYKDVLTEKKSKEADFHWEELKKNWLEEVSLSLFENAERFSNTHGSSPCGYSKTGTRPEQSPSVSSRKRFMHRVT